MASTNRNISKYHMKIGNKVVHRGITNDIERRENEHMQSWPDAHITKIGNQTTRDAGLKWEREGGKR